MQRRNNFGVAHPAVTFDLNRLGNQEYHYSQLPSIAAAVSGFPIKDKKSLERK
jgi:hypothetical protein